MALGSGQRAARAAVVAGGRRRTRASLGALDGGGGALVGVGVVADGRAEMCTMNGLDLPIRASLMTRNEGSKLLGKWMAGWGLNKKRSWLLL
ncbi:hypothetical protein ACLOJK_034449 [Asimina triloba]